MKAVRVYRPKHEKQSKTHWLDGHGRQTLCGKLVPNGAASPWAVILNGQADCNNCRVAAERAGVAQRIKKGELEGGQKTVGYGGRIHVYRGQGQ